MSANIPEELKQEALILLRAKLTETLPIEVQENNIKREETNFIHDTSDNTADR